MLPVAAIEWEVALIPVVAGGIGYATNWLAVKMMFQPLHFRGVGRVGWQGVIPSKAAKMGSISVDTGLAKLGSLGEFYEQLDPEKIAQHIVASSREEVRAQVERIVQREHPRLWADMPPRIREGVHERVQANLPQLVSGVTEDIGRNIDHLMDLKLMVVRHMDENPELANRIFQEVGEKEFRFIVSSGAYFGFALGLVQMLIWIVFPAWWVLPAAGLIVGLVTNYVALQIIFSPIEPTRIGPIVAWGLFLRRQKEVAEVYSRLITDNVLTLRNIVEEMINGPQSDRTRRLIEERLRPAVDQAVGIARPAVRLAVGTREYDAIRDSLAAEAVDFTLGSLEDPAFNRERGEVLHGLIRDRMAELSPREFSALLRTAFEEDEWQLVIVGGALGCAAGAAQLVFVFGGG